MTLTADRIRSWRKARGWTQKVLARRLGVHPVTVARWELGTATPRGLSRRALGDLVDGRGRGGARR